MNRNEFINEVAALVRGLIPTICDDDRAYPDEPSGADGDGADDPSMLLTIGADADGWAFQTGDNSYSGGAYHYATWGIAALYRGSDAREVAQAIADEIEELRPDDAPIFDDRASAEVQS